MPTHNQSPTAHSQDSERSIPSFRLPWLPEKTHDGPQIGITGDFVVNENLESLIIDSSPAMFDSILPWTAPLDLLIMTLDATFPGDDPKTPGPQVVTGSATLRALPQGKSTLLNLGNNHTFDMGLEGFKALKAAADSLGLSYVGAGETLEDAEKPWKADIAGTSLAIHAAVHYGSHPRPPLSCGAQVAYLDSPSWREGIRQSVADGHTVLVLLHGGLEGCQYPSVAALEISHDLAELDVAMVVWSHAHVVQGGEIHNNAPIAYGLGNAFYPALNGDPHRKNTDPRYDRGLFLDLNIHKNGLACGRGLAVTREGVTLNMDKATSPWEAEQVRLSRKLGSRHYSLFFRALRLWEDVFLHTWHYFRRDSLWRQIRRLNWARVRGLIRSFRNIRADAEDV